MSMRLRVLWTDGSKTKDILWLRHTGTDIYYGITGAPGFATHKGSYHASGAHHVDRARILVLQSPLTVTEITVACGFVGLSHLSAAYKRRFGSSPRRERRRQHQS